MKWQILLSISVLTGATEVILQKLLMKNDNSDPIAYSIVFQFLGGLICLVFLLFHGIKLTGFSSKILNIILIPFFFALANFFIFKSLKSIEASKFTLFFATRSIWIIIAAILFFGEIFSFRQILGTILILSSVYLVSWKSKKFTFEKGDIYSLSAGCAFGLGLADVSYVIRTVDVFLILPIVFISPAVLTLILYPKTIKNMSVFFEKKIFFFMSLLSFFAALSAITYFLAYQVGRNAAQIAALNQTITVISVLLAIFLLKERSEIAKKILAAVISFIGVILVG